MRSPLAVAVLLAVAVSIAPSAQVTLGVQGGVNASNLAYNPDGLFDGDGFDKRVRLGFAVGAFADVPIWPSLSLRPEVVYAQGGYVVVIERGLFPDQEVDLSYTVKADYIEVPVLLSYRVPTAKGLALTLEAGPSLAYNVGSGVSCGSANPEAYCQDLQGSALRDFALDGSAGVTVGAGPVGVGLRFTHGITAISWEEPAGQPVLPGARKRALTAMAHYVFGR